MRTTFSDWMKRPHGCAASAAAEYEKRLFIQEQRREQFEEEVWCAHKWLDDRGVPRADVGGEVFSLVGRMTRLIESKSNA